MSLLTTLMMALAGALLASPLLAGWDAISTRYIKDLYIWCERLYFDTTYLVFYMRLWGLCMLAVFVVLGLLLHLWPITILVLYLVYHAPRLILSFLVKRQKMLLRDQLVSAISIMSNSTKAGLSLEEATSSIAKEAPAPLNREFRRIVGEYRHGRTFIEALEDAKTRMNLNSFTLFSAALTTNKIYGGDVNVTLERLRKSLLENQRLERKLEANTASGQMVINVLAVFPAIFLVLAYVINPDGTKLLFTTIVGQVVVTLAILLVYVGYLIGLKILDKVHQQYAN